MSDKIGVTHSFPILTTLPSNVTGIHKKINRYMAVTKLRQMSQMPHTEIDDFFLYTKISFKKYEL